MDRSSVKKINSSALHLKTGNSDVMQMRLQQE